MPTLEIEAEDGATGRTLQMWDTRTKDPVAQSQRSELEIREIDQSGRIVSAHRFSTAQRWVYRFELELLLRLAGFSRWTVRGGGSRRYSHAPFSPHGSPIWRMSVSRWRASTPSGGKP